MVEDAITGQLCEVVQRRMTVFGQDRGTTGEWPGERGFVDGTVDQSTGLTQLGARAYDAALGRFLSVEPLMNLVDAQTMNGYAYANNSPASYWDGTGLSYCTPADGICLSGNTATVVYKKPNGNGGNQHWNYSRKSGWRKITENRYRYQSNGSYRTQRYTSSGGWGGWKTVTPAGAVARNPVNYTLPPETQALNEASQQNSPSFWERSGNWINDNWSTIGTIGTAVGLAACIALSFGACLVASGAVALGKLALDGYQNWATDGSMRWSEHALGVVGLGLGGIFSGGLNGAMRYGMTSRGLRNHFSLRRIKDDFFNLNVRTNPNGSFDPHGTVLDGSANMTSVVIGNEVSGLR